MSFDAGLTHSLTLHPTGRMMQWSLQGQVFIHLEEEIT